LYEVPCLRQAGKYKVPRPLRSKILEARAETNAAKKHDSINSKTESNLLPPVSKKEI
jgi:hypothetical protein